MEEKMAEIWLLTLFVSHEATYLVRATGTCIVSKKSRYSCFPPSLWSQERPTENPSIPRSKQLQQSFPLLLLQTKWGTWSSILMQQKSPNNILPRPVVQIKANHSIICKNNNKKQWNFIPKTKTKQTPPDYHKLNEALNQQITTAISISLRITH